MLHPHVAAKNWPRRKSRITARGAWQLRAKART